MVSAPVLVPHTVTDWFAVCLVSTIIAVLLYVLHTPLVGVILREYLNTPNDGEVMVKPPSVAAFVLAVVVLVRALTVPRVAAGAPLNESVTVMLVGPFVI